MLKISVIITTKNEEKVIEDLLSSIKGQSYRNFEVILVDNYSTDDTVNIASNYGVKAYTKGPERSFQRNFGVKGAKGDLILILDADMILTKDVLRECSRQFGKESNMGALIIPEKSFGEGFWTKCRVFEREFYVGEESIEAARCFRKAIFLKFGGYDETITGPEDFDLPLRMRKNGVKIGRIRSYILHNEGKFSPVRSAKKKFYYAAHAQTYLASHPEMAIKQGNFIFRPVFFRKWRNLVGHPILSLGMFIVKALEMMGALSGIVYSGIIRKEK